MNFLEFITGHEIWLRLGFFFAVFAIMASWEVIAPRRELALSKLVRWGNNLGLTLLNSFLLRLLFPAAAVGMAVFVHEQGWGAFNYYTVPTPVAILVSFLVLDFIIYLQHVMVHAVPLLWRLHRVHHADVDFDVTTGARFHPLEIVLSMGIKFVTIMVLGAPVVAVIIFEIILNAAAMFNHSNVRIPESVDRVLRWLIVTPDMHRVHHSVELDETNSNFCFNLPWWDHLFGTYRDSPRAGHIAMTIGLANYREAKQVAWLPGMLAFPWIKTGSGNAAESSIKDKTVSAHS